MKKRGFEIAKGWENSGINLPRRSTAHAAAYDIEAAEDLVVPPFRPGLSPTLIPTGLKAYCRPDECYFILNRSSGPKHGIVLANSIGLVDADYYNNTNNDGHFFVAIYNVLDHDLKISKGERIAQVVFQKFLVTDHDSASGVRTGGFGSTDRASFVETLGSYDPGVTPDDSNSSLSPDQPKNDQSKNDQTKSYHSKAPNSEDPGVTPDQLIIVYDVDDVLWGLTKKVYKILHLPYEKQITYQVRENPLLSHAEQTNIMNAYADAETFSRIKFYPGTEQILQPEQFGTKVLIHSNCYSEAIAQNKLRALRKILPDMPASQIHMNVIDLSINHKHIKDQVFIFVDDSPYNIATSHANINILPREPWNILPEAQRIACGKTGEIVEPTSDRLQTIVEHPEMRYIIYADNLTEINRIIQDLVQLKTAYRQNNK